MQSLSGVRSAWFSTKDALRLRGLLVRLGRSYYTPFPSILSVFKGLVQVLYTVYTGGGGRENVMALLGFLKSVIALWALHNALEKALWRYENILTLCVIGNF